MNNRREFIKKAAKIGIGSQFIFTTPLELIANTRSKISSNDKINFGVIGCKGMGWSDISSILKNSETDCIAICDVDDKVLEERSENVKDITGLYDLDDRILRKKIFDLLKEILKNNHSKFLTCFSDNSKISEFEDFTIKQLLSKNEF